MNIHEINLPNNIDAEVLVNIIAFAAILAQVEIEEVVNALAVQVNPNAQELKEEVQANERQIDLLDPPPAAPPVLRRQNAGLVVRRGMPNPQAGQQDIGRE